MKKILSLAAAFGMMFYLSSCSDDDDSSTPSNPEPENPEEVVVTQNITSNTTWTASSTYVLAGRIVVTEGNTLTIEPGTVIKGQQGTGSNAKALLIARGAKIMAEGTASKPIIFTSISDQLTKEDVAAGDFESPNLQPDVSGLWGGLLILGDAPITAASTTDDNVDNLSETNVEGIPSSSEGSLYGGTEAEDNSGVLSYVSIRHGGANIGSGNEINGITLAGVGSGTSISNIEIVGNQDDGIEWFGGNVSVSNVVVWNAGDDGLDTDQDWVGTCSNFIIVAPDGSAFELDGPEGERKRGVPHKFDKGTVYAGDKIDRLVDWDPSTNAQLTNIYFYGISTTYGYIEDEDPETEGNQEFSPIESFGGDESGTSSNWEYTLLEGSREASDIFYQVPSEILKSVEANQNSVGVQSETGFEWTFASQSGALSNIGL